MSQFIKHLCRWLYVFSHQTLRNNMLFCTFFLPLCLQSVLHRYTDSDYLPQTLLTMFLVSMFVLRLQLNTILCASSGSCSLICTNGLECNYYIVIRKKTLIRHISFPYTIENMLKLYLVLQILSKVFEIWLMSRVIIQRDYSIYVIVIVVLKMIKHGN